MLLWLVLLAGCRVDSNALGGNRPPVTPPPVAPTPTAPEPIPVVAPEDAAAIDAAAEIDVARSPDLPPPSPDAPPPDAPPVAAVDAGNGCPEARGGPALVKVADFCIDATEVTNAQYQLFWRARGSGREVAGQGRTCAWNDSFTPAPGGGARWPPRPGDEQRPVVNVDWCDAFAFCQWAGKRLCGRIGSGGLARWQDSAVPETSQWAYACASGGRSAYPYGNSFRADACNSGQPIASATSLVDVASRPACRTGSGVFDLSGNVEEWVDACTGGLGPDDMCAVIGASAFHKDPSDLSCRGSPYPDRRAQTYELRGFRCCAP
jgi:sulfatase modifying factor 1